MTTILAAAVTGALASAVVWSLMRQVFAHPTLMRRNVRGLDVPTAGGLVMALALVPVWAVFNVHVALELEVLSFRLLGSVWIIGLVAVFSLLGVVDDVLAEGEERGFRGHLGALVRGRLTTGGVKLVGGGLAALALTANGGPVWEWAVDAAIVALAANTANLLDRAPGRVTKVSVVALVALVALVDSDGRAGLAAVALVVGLAVGLLLPELRERVMLGDTGANPLGAALGVGVVAVAGPWASVAVLAALVALNLASEKVSFSAVISRTPPLRWLDELGRPTE